MIPRERLHWLAYIVSMVTVIATLLTTAVVIYLYFFDGNPPVEYRNISFPTNKAEYTIGDKIYVHIKYCKSKYTLFKSQISFVDGLVFDLPEKLSTGLAAGCHESDVHIATIPDKLPAGEYHLRGVTEYKVNILRTRTVEWTTRNFMVVK